MPLVRHQAHPRCHEAARRDPLSRPRHPQRPRLPREAHPADQARRTHGPHRPPPLYQELIGTTDLIQNGGVDWTIVRFTAPNNKLKNGKLRVGFYGTDRIGFTVSRADIAAFTAAQVEDDAYLNRAPAISN